MKRNNKIKIVVLICLSLIMPFVIRNVKADTSYPVLEWDSEAPIFVGTSFVVIFTCFSDSDDPIHLEIWLDDFDLEWEANAPYFVNQEVLINTQDQLSGTDHKLLINATDYLGREKTLTAFFTIDTVSPVFNELGVYPLEEDKIIIDKDTDLMIKWNITDENFWELHAFKDEGRILVSPDKIGTWNYTIYTSKESFDFTLRCVAIDDANNTAEESFIVSYVVEEGEFVPKEEVDLLLAQQKKQRNIILVAAGAAIVASVPFGVVAAIIFSRKKKETNL